MRIRSLHILLFGLTVALASSVSSQTPPATAPLPFIAHPIRTPDGLTIQAQEWGNPNGPAILFIHGASNSYLAWKRQYESSLAQRYRIVTYDLRGHGNSDKPTGREYYQEAKRWADEVNAVIEQTKLVRPVVVAWSYGGRVVADYLATYGDGALGGINFVDAVTSNAHLGAGMPAVLAGAGRDSPDQQRHLDGMRNFLRACFVTPPNAEDFQLLLGSNLLTPGYVRRNLGGRPAPYDVVLAATRVPVLVTHGAMDPAIPLAMARYTAATVPNARLSVIESAGHLPFYEQAEQFNRELAQLVDSANKRE